jgi:hypothetical protein
VSYSPAGRRARRRRTTIVTITVLTLVAVAFGVTQAEGEREATRAYLDVVFAVARDEAAMAAGFTSMISTIDEYSRAAMVQTLDELEEIGATSLDRILDADPPAALVAANQSLRIAVSRWRSGLSEVRAGLVALSVNPIDEEGLATLGRGLIELRVGDSAYLGFLSEMSGIDTDMHGGALPSVAFVPVAEAHLFDPRDLARRMLLAPGLGVVVDLAVADLRLDPPPLGMQGGLPVVPAASTYLAEATISNRGNIDQADIQVDLRLVSGEGLLHEEAMLIPGLKAGQMTTVAFSPLPLTPGSTYELTIRVPEGDSEPENDRRTITFIVNPDE